MFNRPSIAIAGAPYWRRPVLALMLMAVANQFGFATWNALHTNFAIDAIGFQGREMGILHTVREIPGFLSFAAVFFLLIMREQTLGLLSLLAIGFGVAVTGFFPSPLGFYVTTIIKSLGFHYYETVNQSLALQWFEKKSAAADIGKVVSAASFATIGAYGVLFVTWKLLELDYVYVFLAGGLLTVAVVIFAYFWFPYFREEVPQRRQLVLRRRYWLYYAITFMSGARRQIFIIFAVLLMVQKFEFDVSAITLLMLVNAVINTLAAPKLGALIAKWGDRNTMIVENLGLVAIFVLYAVATNPWFASGLYVLDNAFFFLAIAHRTYFQKIADPADIAPTSGVAFSINHIAAVTIPIPLGIIWDVDPATVFLIGSAMAGVALILSLLVPKDPEPGRETTMLGRAPSVAPAE
ncbi:MAG TPA: MFS transporter [Aestuariivirgaceae bacterium]|nr:MFS transporter [Aestuariivirgaceae bacterium]